MRRAAIIPGIIEKPPAPEAWQAMAHFRLKKGLDLPLAGVPREELHEGARPRRVALLGRDCLGVRPRLLVAEGDHIRRGQPVLADKTHPEILFTAPGGGVVESVNRGHRRVLLSVVIRLSDQEETERFEPVGSGAIDSLSRDAVRERMLSSGAWTALRRRPYGGIPAPGEVPSALFVTAHDTRPLAMPPEAAVAGRDQDLTAGLAILRRLLDGPIHFCTGQDWSRPLPDLPGLHHATFSGPHPAGNPGTHIHLLHPADKNRPVWHIDLQDLLDCGRIFEKGEVPVERIVALGGPGARRPRLLKTRLGVDLQDLLDGELEDGRRRIISGSVLEGHTAAADEAFLGRRDQQVTVLAEDLDRSFLGWANPLPSGLFSLKRVVLGAWAPHRLRSMTTSRHGGVRALVPGGSYEQVMPLNIMPTFLLRALLCGDVDEAEALGCLELVEEDLALCTVVCPSKIEYGPLLRMMLDQIEKEG